MQAFAGNRTRALEKSSQVPQPLDHLSPWSKVLITTRRETFDHLFMKNVERAVTLNQQDLAAKKESQGTKLQVT